MPIKKDTQDPEMLTINRLIDAQVAFMQQWLHNHAEALTMDAWHWFSAQPMNQYVSCKDLQRLINDWLLSQPTSTVMRQDIRDILRTLIYHPVNDHVPLSEIVDDSQVVTLATTIGSHEQQRNILIHSFIARCSKRRARFCRPRTAESARASSKARMSSRWPRSRA